MLHAFEQNLASSRHELERADQGVEALVGHFDSHLDNLTDSHYLWERCSITSGATARSFPASVINSMETSVAATPSATDRTNRSSSWKPSASGTTSNRSSIPSHRAPARSSTRVRAAATHVDTVWLPKAIPERDAVDLW